MLHLMLRLSTPLAMIAVRQATCPQFPQPPANQGSGDGAAPPRIDAGSLRAAAPTIGTAPGVQCIAYDFRLRQQHRDVEVRAGVEWALVIALRAGKAVAARMLPSGTLSTRFENLAVDQVLVYCGGRADMLEVCVDVVPDPDDEEQQWAGSPLIAKGIQVPIRALDPTLGSQADEDALAKSRLVAGEDFDERAFHNVTELMNAAAADVEDAAPVWSSSGRARGARRALHRAPTVVVRACAADRAGMAADARLRLSRPCRRARDRRRLRLPHHGPLPASGRRGTGARLPLRPARHDAADGIRARPRVAAHARACHRSAAARA